MLQKLSLDALLKPPVTQNPCKNYFFIKVIERGALQSNEWISSISACLLSLRHSYSLCITTTTWRAVQCGAVTQGWVERRGLICEAALSRVSALITQRSHNILGLTTITRHDSSFSNVILYWYKYLKMKKKAFIGSCLTFETKSMPLPTNTI